YFGGEGFETETHMDMGIDGCIYIASTTNSTTNIATLPTNYSGGIRDGFLIKFDSTGNRIWSTYFGGEDNEGPKDMHCDHNGDIVVVGYTLSHTGIATPGAYQINHAGILE